MPIYEYYCPRCKKKFELLRPMSQCGQVALCPICRTESEPVFSKFACFSKDGQGSSAPVGGSACSGCSSGNCSSCGL